MLIIMVTFVSLPNLKEWKDSRQAHGLMQMVIKETLHSIQMKDAKLLEHALMVTLKKMLKKMLQKMMQKMMVMMLPPYFSVPVPPLPPPSSLWFERVVIFFREYNIDLCKKTNISSTKIIKHSWDLSPHSKTDLLVRCLHPWSRIMFNLNSNQILYFPRTFQSIFSIFCLFHKSHKTHF